MPWTRGLRAAAGHDTPAHLGPFVTSVRPPATPERPCDFVLSCCLELAGALLEVVCGGWCVVMVLVVPLAVLSFIIVVVAVLWLWSLLVVVVVVVVAAVVVVC